MGLAVIGANGTLSLRFDDRRARDLKISRLDVAPDDATAYEVIPVRDGRVVPGAAPIDYSLCGRRDVPRAPMFVEGNRFAVWDLMRSIEETRLPVSNVYSARTVVEMICGIYASHLDGKRIAFPLSDRRH
jgi:hypothetical protein